MWPSATVLARASKCLPVPRAFTSPRVAASIASACATQRSSSETQNTHSPLRSSKQPSKIWKSPLKDHIFRRAGVPQSSRILYFRPRAPALPGEVGKFRIFFRQTCYDQLARQTIPSILTGRHSCTTRFMWHKHTCSVALPLYRRRSNTRRRVPKPIALAPLCRTTGCGASFLPGFCAWLQEVTHAKMRS